MNKSILYLLSSLLLLSSTLSVAVSEEGPSPEKLPFQAQSVHSNSPSQNNEEPDNQNKGESPSPKNNQMRKCGKGKCSKPIQPEYKPNQ